MQRFKSVESYIEAQTPEWKAILQDLRTTLNKTDLEETVKWGAPAYTYKGKILVGMGAFKNFVAVWFHQGALLQDKKKKLINAQEGVTKALRQWRLESKDDLETELIMAYVKESIQNQDEGKEIKPDREKGLEIPRELKIALEEHPEILEKFEEMSKSKKREYAEHISGAKKEETRKARLEKILPMILEGKGLHDKYK